MNTGRPFTVQVHVQYPYTLPAQDRWPHGNYMYVAEGEAEAEAEEEEEEEAEAEAEARRTPSHTPFCSRLSEMSKPGWGEAGGGAGNRST